MMDIVGGKTVVGWCARYGRLTLWYRHARTYSLYLSRCSSATVDRQRSELRMRLYRRSSLAASPTKRIYCITYRAAWQGPHCVIVLIAAAAELRYVCGLQRLFTPLDKPSRHCVAIRAQNARRFQQGPRNAELHGNSQIKQHSWKNDRTGLKRRGAPMAFSPVLSIYSPAIWPVNSFPVLNFSYYPLYNRQPNVQRYVNKDV